MQEVGQGSAGQSGAKWLGWWGVEWNMHWEAGREGSGHLSTDCLRIEAIVQLHWFSVTLSFGCWN